MQETPNYDFNELDIRASHHEIEEKPKTKKPPSDDEAEEEEDDYDEHEFESHN